MRNLIAFNLFLFLFCFGFNAMAACEAGQITKLVNIQEVGYEDKETKEKKTALLQAGTEVHVTTIKDGQALIYAMRDSEGTLISGLATLDLKEVIALECQS